MQPLLSIVVPTKNRYFYLKHLVRLFLSFNFDNVELVIQDNSDDNADFKEYIFKYSNLNVEYYYTRENLSVCENCDRAIQNSKGKYICMIGDDDGFLRNIETYVRYMESKGIDSMIANKPAYKWPDVHGVVFDFSATVRIEKYTGKVETIDLSSEMKKLLRLGAITLGKLPCVYHGIVKKDILDRVFAKTGTYFPGPSPDMANAVALGLCSIKHVYYDNPVVISGQGVKSAGGMGAKHQHQNEIKNLSFLPLNTDELWEKRIPKYWTGETIYAESAVKALTNMGEKKLVAKFNYSYLYASFVLFHLSKSRLALRLMRPRDMLLFPYYFCKVLYLRCGIFVRNFMLRKGWRRNKYIVGPFENINSCEEYISNKFE